MVVKPASQTPMTAFALGELAIRAGIPAGVFNVISGNDTRIIGGLLTSHKLVRKVTFTGSTEVGACSAAPVGRNYQEVLDGARWQRTVHRL